LLLGERVKPEPARVPETPLAAPAK